jgi:uncharacterized alpha-E superfamily protein
MLSRTAQAVYWMSRYVERAENVARFIEVNGHLMLDLPLTPANQWEALLYTTGDQSLFQKYYEITSRQNVIDFLTFDNNNPNSIVSCLARARENARSVREIISTEMWEQINKFYHMVLNSDRMRAIDSMHAYYTSIKEASHLFTGISYTTMPRNEAWFFGHLGGLLERADKTSRILDVKYFLLLPSVSDVGTPFDNIQWSALLKSASGLEAYRKKHGQLNPEKVVEFLILDHVFPRSIQFCLMEAQKTIGAITGSPLHTFHNPVEQRLGRLSAQLNYTNIDEIFAIGLHEFLDQTQIHIGEIDKAIFETFFILEPSEPSV